MKERITTISTASFGIFLSHALVLDILAQGKLGITIHALVIHPVLGIPITTLLVFLLSTVLILGLQKVNKTIFG